MAEPQWGSVPFEEALSYLKGKILVKTETWDQLLASGHAKGFTVAGATVDGLLEDLFAAVKKVKESGGTITDFRKDFDAAVEKCGWSYKGSRGWRTRVIYDTNLRTADMAGRWQQLQRTKGSRPYLQYLTAGDSRVRPQHRAWDKLVLPIDHKDWDWLYPPNGWGCRCTVRSLSERQLQRNSLTVAESAPVTWEERVSPDGVDYGPHPKGIDTGWSYNVGKAWLGPDVAFGEQLMALPPSLRDFALQQAQTLAPRLQAAYEPVAAELRRLIASGPDTQVFPRNHVYTVGYLTPELVAALSKERVALPRTATVTVTDHEIAHLAREAKAGRIPDTSITALPSLMANPMAILWDSEDPALVYVLALDAGSAEKVIVAVDFPQKVRGLDDRRYKAVTNSVRTSGVVLVSNLDPGRYHPLVGSLESPGGTPPSP